MPYPTPNTKWEGTRFHLSALANVCHPLLCLAGSGEGGSRACEFPYAAPVLSLVLAATLANAPVYALIVANNASNDDAVADLKFADDDGARYFGFFELFAQDARLLSVLDAQTQARFPGVAARTRPPTRREVLDALKELNQKMATDRAKGAHPTFFFVFTGHGKRGTAGEGSISFLDGNFTRTELFKEVLAPLQASTTHLIIDACDSYFFVNQRGTLPTAPSQAAVVSQFLEERTLAKFPDVGVILSTSAQQESHEWAAIEAGVFSHEVLSALMGAADVNSDARIEYSELKAFVAAANERVADPRARVAMYAQAPARDGHAALSDLTRKGTGAFLLLPAGLEGRHWLEDGRGVRLADFNKEAERPLLLLVPPRDELFLRNATQESVLSGLAPGRVVDALIASWRTQSVAARGGSLDESFRRHLFERPYGARFYGGFVASSTDLAVLPPVEADLSP